MPDEGIGGYGVTWRNGWTKQRRCGVAAKRWRGLGNDEIGIEFVKRGRELWGKVRMFHRADGKAGARTMQG
jgi:hypothetical protein